MRASNRALSQWKPPQLAAYTTKTMRARPLSVCLKLQELANLIQPKRASYLPTAEIKHLTQNNQQNNLYIQEDYNSKTPIEPSTNPLCISEHRYPSLRALKQDKDIGDGLWLCCHCRHENILRHYSGHYSGHFPFKHLTCSTCNRVLCSRCQTTKILSPLPYGMIHAPQPPGDDEVRYLHVCTACGLSHRAEMVNVTLDFHGVMCAGCGMSSFGEWARWHIGSVEPYRRDSDKSYVRLVERKAERVANLVYHWDGDEPALLRLGCKNPD